jgi:hypothetical protein
MFNYRRIAAGASFGASFCVLLAGLVACDQRDPNEVTEDTETSDDTGSDDTQPTDMSTPEQTETETGDTTDVGSSAPDGTEDAGAGTDGSSTDGTTTEVPSPDTDAGAAPDPQPELDYFPMLNGGVWTYRHTKVGDEVWNEVVTMTEATGQNAPGYLLVDQPNRDGETTEQIWRWVDTAVMRVNRRELKDGNLLRLSTYDPGFTRFDTRWTTQGFEETITYTRMEQESGLGPVVEERTQHFEVLETQASVTIDDTTYEDCLLVARTRPDTGDVGHYWFAPGVGKVKELDPDSMTMEELIDFSLP